MRFIFISILLVFAQFALAQKNVLKSPAPEWVNDISFNEENILEDNGGYQYLLIDYQDNFIKKASFRHFAIKLINSNGIQSNSDISVVFDPSYQKLTFHKISIIRDGQPIDKLELQNFQVFQRESSLERALYDGSLTAVLNLTDVRENDIIEYSYTLTGFNPIYKEIFSNTFYHQYSIPVNRIYNRLIVNNKKEFAYKLFNENIEPQIITNSGNKEYIWNLEAFDFKLYDTNIPSWIDIHKRVSFTSAENWNDIVNWALPLYTFDKKKVEKIAKSITESDSIKQAALDFIRFVQDNIRYLGFEDGINAFKPHQPEKVFAQRYGDCKDKSLLLVALLQSIGIDAHPLLVNTYLKNEILNELPSINSFNHCIACFSIDGRNYVIDPTISYQGGDLDNLSTPNYCYGLMIKKGETGLTQIIPTPKPTIKIDEILSLDSINGNAKFEVSTEYSSAKANSTRDYFNSSSRDVIKKDYTDFYRNLYPRIETATEINLTDKNRKSSNKLFVKENYFVKKIWENSTTPNKIYCEIYPLVLENYINYDQAINRKLPYYLGEPFAFSQTTEVNLPESWNSKNYNFSTENEAFKYNNKIINKGNKILVTHNFELLKNTVPGDSIESFLMQIDKVKDEMHYYLTYNNNNLTKFKISWISILIALISTILSVLLMIFIYKKYDPQPDYRHTNKPFGGWLILPIIGLLTTPLVLSIQIFTQHFFNQNTWVNIYQSPETLPTASAFLIAGEIIYNFFILTFSIFLIILLFKKRSSFPNLMSVYYTVALLGAIADLVFSKIIMPDLITASLNNDSVQTIIRLLFVAFIWIPYFQFSERVKTTFCKTIS